MFSADKAITIAFQIQIWEEPVFASISVNIVNDCSVWSPVVV